METAVPKVCVGEPQEFQPKEVDDFVAFVLAGGEVAANGLRNLVMQSRQIAFVREKACLLGVAGLKKPRESYRKKVACSSRTELDDKDFPFELGWIFILPSARGRGLSFPLCQPLVAAVNGAGIFSTSRTTNDPMHRTLEKLGFSRAGTEWPSQQIDDNLALFLRHA